MLPEVVAACILKSASSSLCSQQRRNILMQKVNKVECQDCLRGWQCSARHKHRSVHFTVVDIVSLALGYGQCDHPWPMVQGEVTKEVVCGCQNNNKALRLFPRKE